MRPSNFTIILTMAVLMVIGAALMPSVDVGTEPPQRQGKTLTIRVSWPGAAAKVVEQSITAPIEGMVAALKGIQSVASNSRFGRGEITVTLKPEADVSAVRFEISSLLRQSYDHLPEGAGYPSLSGGEVVTATASHNERKLLLTYTINADLPPDRIKDYVEQNIAKPIERVEGLSEVKVTGATDRYIEIDYNPERLAACGLKGSDIAEAIKNFIGREEIIGEIRQENGEGQTERAALRLATASFSKPLEQMPIANKTGKIFYLNELATYSYKDYEPSSYYRVNGMNTIYLNVYAPADAKVIPLSDKAQEAMETVKEKMAKGVYVKLTHDEAEVQREEMYKLVSRTTLSLLILLLFVWLTSRNLRYLAIIATALAASLLIAIIAYKIAGIQLHVYSLAGITVSLGLIIDSTIVMADHYSYYRNRKAFLAILAALLTTIGSLIVIFFLPGELRSNLYDFAWIIIINLTVSLLVAYFFVPSLVDTLHYSSKKARPRHAKAIARWNRFYTAYLSFTSKRRWIYYILIALAFGGSIKLFINSLNDNRRPEEENEKRLHIMAEMPLGGTAAQLNEKVKILEEYLKTFKEIKTFTTRIDGRGGSIDVAFKDEWKDTGFPFILENKVIGKMITIGGTDWSTYGISQRGFSNSLNLQHRNNRIVVSGYNYAQLYRVATDICDYMRKNNRVQDIIIETPGREVEEDEFFMRYDEEKMMLAKQTAGKVHSSLKGMLKKDKVGHYHDRYVSSDIYLMPETYDDFDLWHLHNAGVRTDSADVSVPALMTIEKRAAKNSIRRENQEYVLNVAFNVLGSYAYERDYIKSVIAHFSQRLPIGYKCGSPTWSQQEKESTKYWLIALIVVIIFFICTILFESLRAAAVIISIIPVTLIGSFLTFYFTGEKFGEGGFASLVLLCGITVNSGIYILNQYNIIRNGSNSIRLYVKAYNHKIVPVLLTVISTVMGLIPFFIDGDDEPFWFSFATGVTGGLLLSIIAIIFVMPLFVKFSRR